MMGGIDHHFVWHRHSLLSDNNIKTSAMDDIEFNIIYTLYLHNSGRMIHSHIKHVAILACHSVLEPEGGGEGGGTTSLKVGTHCQTKVYFCGMCAPQLSLTLFLRVPNLPPETKYSQYNIIYESDQNSSTKLSIQ